MNQRRAKAKTKSFPEGKWGVIWDLTPTQKPFVFDFEHDFCGLGGGAGNGKTFSLNRKAILSCQLVPGLRSVICRETRGVLEEITVPDFAVALLGENGTPEDFREHPGVTNWAKGSLTLTFSNRSTIKFLAIGEPEKGIREIEKQLSRNVGQVNIDQADRINFDVFNYLIMRNRQALRHPVTGDPIVNQINITYNPAGYTHWIYQCFIKKNPKFVKSLSHKYKTYEYSTQEAALLPQSVMEKYDNLPKALRRRFFLGEWGAMEGAVYDEWNPDIHVVPYFEVPTEWDHYLVFDYGFAKPSCFLLFAVTRKCKETPDIPENIVFCIREHYQAGMKIYEHSQVLDHMIQGRKMAKKIADPQVWQVGKDGDTIGNDYNKYGHYFQRANNDQRLGVARVQTMLQPTAKNVSDVVEVLRTVYKNDYAINSAIFEKASRLMILENMCPHTVEEIPSQEYSKLAGLLTGSSLLKEGQKDHAADCVRYFCNEVSEQWTPDQKQAYSAVWKMILQARRKRDSVKVA